MLSLRRALLLALLTFFALPSLAYASGGGVRPLLDPSSLQTAPFPSNHWTTVDKSQNTWLRVDLPKPDCAVRPSDCADIDVLNTLDGFNLQPRISIPFTGPIDPTSVDSSNVFLVRLPDFQVTGINQIAWEPAANTLHVESDQLLRQHTTYVLVVTTDVRDASGKKIKHAWFNNATPPPRASRESRRARSRWRASSRPRARRRCWSRCAARSRRRPRRPPDFVIGAGGERTVFPLAGVTSILFSRQTGDRPGFAVSAAPATPFLAGRRHDRVRRLRLARLPDPVEGDPAGRQPHRRARGAGDEPSLLQPLPPGRDRARGRLAGRDLRPRVHGQQEREPVRRRRLDGAARDRDDRDQRRRPRLRPARNPDREPRGRRARRAARRRPWDRPGRQTADRLDRGRQRGAAADARRQPRRPAPDRDRPDAARPRDRGRDGRRRRTGRAISTRRRSRTSASRSAASTARSSSPSSRTSASASRTSRAARSSRSPG